MKAQVHRFMQRHTCKAVIPERDSLCQVYFFIFWQIPSYAVIYHCNISGQSSPDELQGEQFSAELLLERSQIRLLYFAEEKAPW